MPLPTGKPMRNRCGHCRLCVAACPVEALKEASFEDHPRRIEDTIDLWKCNAWVNRTWRKGDLCFACVVACPKGSARKWQR
ncbi:MAG: 4Fe-4S dicluster domain-containing protein [Thermoplasmata archaeon]